MDCESRSILISRDEGRCLYLGISSIYDGVVEVPDPELVAVTKETSPIGIAADRWRFDRCDCGAAVLAPALEPYIRAAREGATT